MTAAGSEPADWISHDVYRTTPTAAPHTEPRPDAEPVRLPQDADLTTALPVRLPRFGQLTHTNFHAANGNGGWQVKEATGGITGDEERLLETRTAGFPPGELSIPAGTACQYAVGPGRDGSTSPYTSRRCGPATCCDHRSGCARTTRSRCSMPL